MAVWRLLRDRDDGAQEIDDINVAVVEAANESAARAAALALDSRFPSDYWDNATAEDIETPAFLGGLYSFVQDNGV